MVFRILLLLLVARFVLLLEKHLTYFPMRVHAHGRRVFDEAPEPEQLFAIPGASHNDNYAVGGEPYWRAFREFLDGLPHA
jgi:hypothetical protein